MPTHLVLASSLNLRLAPDRESGSLGTVPRWTRVDEIGANSDRSWLRVQAADDSAWVSNAYLIPESLVSEHAWISRAAREFGVGEYEDSRDPPSNPRVQDYHATYGGDPAERLESIAWCSSFVNWCLRPGFDTDDTDRRARSWRHWGHELAVPRPGAIVVFWRRPEADENAEQHEWPKDRLIGEGRNGHVAFLVEFGGGQAIVLGGNQSSRANALGEVNKKPYPLDSNDYGVLSYRWPTG